MTKTDWVLVVFIVVQLFINWINGRFIDYLDKRVKVLEGSWSKQ